MSTVQKRDQRGISLVETLLVVIMVGVIVFLLANIPNALSLMSKSNHLSAVREIATKQIEDKRLLGFTNLVNGSQPIVDSRLSQLPYGGGTILVEDCPVQICTNEENIKQVTITITWKENNKVQNSIIKTFIGQEGIK